MERPQVLVIGIAPRRVPGPWDPEPVVAAVDAGAAAFADHEVDVDLCLLGLDGRENVDTVLIEVLRARSWACVVVGGGIRKADELLLLFERVVNLVRQHAPQAAIAFNDSPTDTYDAAARWLG